jgi:hypothetical protein
MTRNAEPMMNALHKLARIGSDPVRPGSADDRKIADAFGDPVARELRRLLPLKNGFYAFEAALHVFSDLGDGHEHGLLAWNSEDLWRKDYGGMTDGAVFFAEDVFGAQFGIRKDGVSVFDPETGAFDLMASDMEQWARKVLDDHGVWTGHKVAHDWQAEHGPIPAGARLVPTTPFVLGGDYAVANVRAIEAVKGMKYRASIATQIRDLPDGSPITLRVIE